MNEERIIAYLLEELSPEEAARFEEECFEAETWPDEVSLAEEELVEDYLRGDLPPERRARFRLHYLTTPARRERVRVAAALLRHAEEEEAADALEEVAQGQPAPAVPSGRSDFFESLRAFWAGRAWAGRALAALLVIALVVGVWLLTRRPEPSNLLALTLTASRSERGDGARPATVPALRADDALSVTLLLPEGAGPAERYQVEMEDESGAVTIVEPAVPDANSVKVIIPASRLRRGAFVLKLYAIGGGPVRRVGSYFFSVE